MARQTELVFNRRGGKRKNAGRKRVGRKRVAHTRRPALCHRYPVHITLRIVDGLPSLRRRHAFRAIRKAMYVVLRRTDFRIVHMSIQGNHLHLICEAANKQALSRGMQGFKISAAKRLNAAMGRDGGTVFADRYHEEIIKTPTQMRAALAYVLNNWRRHGEDRGATVRVDHFSTGIYFGGWKERAGEVYVVPDGEEVLPYTPPKTWLLSDGWKKVAPISLYERPGPRS